MRDFNRKQLQAGARELGVLLSCEQCEKICAHLALLVRWNARMNLTRVKPAEMIARHVLDSLSVLQFVHGQKVLDIGSGGGFPGIPLAIASPGLRVTLCESNMRKSAFLRHVCAQLKLANVKVESTPVELLAVSPSPSPPNSSSLSESPIPPASLSPSPSAKKMSVSPSPPQQLSPPRSHPSSAAFTTLRACEKFDTLMARAFAHPAEVVTKTAALQHRGVRMLCMLGRRHARELSAQPAVLHARARIEKLRPPGTTAARHLLILDF